MAEEQKQTSKLEDFVNYEGNLLAIDQFGKGLNSDELGVREKTRNEVRKLSLVPTDPNKELSSEAYDAILTSKKNVYENKRNLIYNESKDEIINQIEAEDLEHKVLFTSPVKLADDHERAELHNGAYKIHKSLHNVAELTHKYSEKEIDFTTFYSGIAGDIKDLVHYILSRGEYKEAIDDNSRKLAVRAVNLVASSSEAAGRLVVQYLDQQRKIEFQEYFKEHEGYNIADYARENLLNNQNHKQNMQDIFKVVRGPKPEKKKAA